jgi:AsmA family/AsmA-like C-terminal region
VNVFRSRRGLAVAGLAILLGLFLVRPGATRLKVRIANSVGLALQREVEIHRVRLRLLPQPGFELENFVVHDDPAFSAEPVLRAQEVSAFLRLSSLLRGRLEISRLSLTEPSLNLTRNDNGRWNIEHLLERTAQVAVAPTSKGRSESRPAFPYIEAQRGRINFKVGAEKKPFALTDANYAIWQDSENAWGMRLRAQPLRTDLNLTDMGEVSVSGSWLRAATLRETPVQFNLQWNEAQLGQLTKLLSGEDRGWRGTASVSADLTGTPADLLVSSDGSLVDFRRYDIVEAQALKMLAHCDAHYSTVDHGFHAVRCDAPSGDGLVTLRGEVLRWRGPRSYDLTIAAEKIPVQSVLSLVRRAKKNLPDDLRASGKLEAHFHLHSGEAGPVLFDGGGETTGFRLVSAAIKSELVLDTVPFLLRTHVPERIGRRSLGQQPSAWPKEPDDLHLVFGPIPLKLGRPTPVTATAWITRAGYNISVEGDTEMPKLLDVARIIGVPAIRPAFTGSAKVNLQVAGNWSGFVTPIATGTAQLHSVRAEVRGLNAPLEIATATVNLGSEQASVQGISASVAGTQWTGTLSFPRMCNLIQACPIRFDLHAEEIVAEKLGELFSSTPPERPWYRFLSTTPQGKPFLLRANASGKLAANRLVVRDLVGTRFTAHVELEDGKLRLSDVRGEVMGGKHRGDWSASFTAKPVTYSGSGAFENVSMGQVANAMHDDWIHGTASGKYTIEMAGYSSAELAASAHGILQFNLRDGTLPHIALAGSPLRVRRFTGSLDFRGPQIEMREGTLDSPNASFAVSGSASLNKRLDFKLVQEGAPAFNVTGTLFDPQVTSASRAETRAALKP